MASSTETRTRFEEILEASRTQDRSNQSATMVVLSHIQQMTLLMMKKGLTFYCDQDTYKSRNKFLSDIISLNKLDIRFPSVIRNFLIDGCGLFYFRPDPKLKYQIYFFNRKQYRVYHDVNGDVDEVVILYSYKVKNQNLGLPSTTYGQNKRYVRLTITADEISEIESDSEKKEQGPDQVKSGNYIIQALHHHFEPNKATTAEQRHNSALFDGCPKPCVFPDPITRDILFE